MLCPDQGSVTSAILEFAYFLLRSSPQKPPRLASAARCCRRCQHFCALDGAPGLSRAGLLSEQTSANRNSLSCYLSWVISEPRNLLERVCLASHQKNFNLLTRLAADFSDRSQSSSD